MVQVPTSEYSMTHPLVCQECELVCTNKNSYSTTALKPFSAYFQGEMFACFTYWIASFTIYTYAVYFLWNVLCLAVGACCKVHGVPARQTEAFNEPASH